MSDNIPTNATPGGVVVPTPPVAVAPVAPAPAPTPAPALPAAAPTAPTARAYNPNSGDPVIDLSVQNYTRAFSVSAEVFQQAIQPALEAGDVNRLDHAALLRAGGAEAAVQAVELVKALAGAVQRRTADTTDQVHQVAGGKEHWVASVTHFNNTQPEFVKEQFLALLTSGDRSKVEYAAKQIVQTAQQAGVVASSLPVQPGAGVPGQVTAYSAREFSEALTALRKEAGNRSLEAGPYADKYRELLARRAAGRQLGK